MYRNYFLGSISLFVVALFLSFWKEGNVTLFAFINSALPTQTLWMSITNYGDALCVGSLLFIFLRKDVRLLMCGVVAGLGVHLSVQFGKNYFSLPRPEHVSDLPHVITLGPTLDIHNYAMPSGHTAAAFMLVMLLAKYYSLQGWRLWALFFAAALIGISRIAVGAHWPSDVFAGAALGMMIGNLCAHEKLNLQHAVFKYIAHLIYLVFLVLSIKRITQVTSISTAISESVIIFSGVIGLILWIEKMRQEIRLRK